MRYLCVFCGSSMGANPAYQAAAVSTGRAIAQQGLGLVYGGGNVGLMGTVADAVLAAGGPVVGVIPQFLQAKEIAHTGLTELHVVASMHERKMMMANLADGFIALPGGYGTLEEFCEILTWAQLGLHTKPCGLLNTARYYDPLLEFFDQAVSARFLKAELRSLVLTHTEPAELLQAMQAYRAQPVDKWIQEEAQT